MAEQNSQLNHPRRLAWPDPWSGGVDRLSPDREHLAALMATVLPRYLGNTLVLMAGVGC
jgi:hypothetical protein